MLRSNKNRRGERGVSFLLVVVGIFSILAMAMFAVDLVVLYAANGEAQKAADAAALAGAKMLVMSSSTSGGTVTNASVCTSGAGTGPMANAAAAAAAQANTIGGVAASLTNVTCTATDAQNPQITVTVGRTNLPLFFARAMGMKSTNVTATATAEAYNNSGGTTSLLNVGSVKPWAVPNCQPGSGAACAADYYIDHNNNYALLNPTAYIGTSISFVPGPGNVAPPQGGYYPIDFTTSTPSPQATLCPAIAGQCSGLTFNVSPYYVDNIACATVNNATQQLTCGSTVQLVPPTAAIATETQSATQCLIHSAGGLGGGQDTINPGPPVTINGGSNNLNPSLRVNNISRSDSIVTVPVFEWAGNPCIGAACVSEQVIGFLQLGINNVLVTGEIDTVVINAVGCNPNSPGSPAIAGGGLTPIPVRLVQ